MTAFVRNGSFDCSFVCLNSDVFCCFPNGFDFVRFGWLEVGVLRYAWIALESHRLGLCIRSYDVQNDSMTRNVIVGHINVRKIVTSRAKIHSLIDGASSASERTAFFIRAHGRLPLSTVRF